MLAIDGSDASVDALIPHLDLALGARDAQLERLALLRPFVRRTPALDAVFAELDHAVQERRITSPACALGAAIGVGQLPLFWFWFQLLSVKHNRSGVPQFQGTVRIDSREDPWFVVEIAKLHHGADRSRDLTTRFDIEHLVDELGIGRCEPAKLPAWLAQAAVTLKTRWGRFYVRTDADAKRIENWLLGA
ncbi:MAG: hypothetical protein H0V17_24960 [Deltaproteobacteria bacterium]|nr:hypothetical protein [Deltaproteobacteria bacterium]